MPVTFDPIGKVRIDGGRYFIELEDKFAGATTGLGEFSHVLVLWYFNLYDSAEARNYLVLDKPYKKGPEKLGVFATRSPVRPSPIAVTSCGLLGLDNNGLRLEVSYIDAEYGTPVLDIKPYEPSDEIVRDVVMPSWCAHWPKCLEESADFNWESEFNF